MQNEEATLSDYWRILKRRLWIIISIFVIVLSSTYIFTKLQTPIFEAEMAIRVEKKTAEPSLANPWSNAPNLATEIQVIKSLAVIKKAVEQIEVFSGDIRERENELYVLARRYQQSTRVEQVENTNILNIRIYSDDPHKSYLLVNAIADIYTDEGVESRRRQAQAVLDYTEKQLVKLKSEIEEGEKDLLKFEQNERVLLVTPEIKTTLERMTVEQTFEFESEMFDIQSKLRELENVLGVTQEDGLLFQSLDSTLPESFVFSSLRRRLLEFEFEKVLLLIDYTAGHPEVQRQEGVITNIKDKIIKMVKESNQLFPNVDMDANVDFVISKIFLEVKREVLYRIINKFYNDSGSLSPDQIKYQELKRTVDRKLEAYNEFLDRSQDAKIAIVSEVADISIVSPPVVPKKAIKPVEKVNYMVGSVVGLLLGIMFAFLIESMDTTIRSIEDVEKVINLPILGIIPTIEVNNEDYYDDKKAKLQLRSLVSVFKPQSYEAESFKVLRTNVMHILEEEKKKVLLFTSSNQREGKTTIAANVALSIAELGKRVVLVGANLKKPTIYQDFGVNKNPGLTDVLIGRYNWREVTKTYTDMLFGEIDIDRLLQIPGIANLNIITSGETVPNASVLLNSQRLDKLIKELKNNFDVVIIVSSPILPSADATVLGHKVDGVVIVSQAGLTKKEVLRRATLHLRNVRAHVMGVVLNNIKSESQIGPWMYYDRRYSEGDVQNSVSV